MSARIIDGKALAGRLREEVRRRAAALTAAGRPACLAGVMVGDDDGSRMYAESQSRAAGEVGIEHRVVRLPAAADTRYAVAAVEALNRDATVSGIVIYQPMPRAIDAAAVQAAIAAAKDVEGVNPANIGLIAMGRAGLAPCTAAAAFECVRSTGIEIAGREAVVVGRSTIVGRPVAALLLGAHATVTQCHTRTVDLPAHCRRGEILIVAAGKPGIIGREHIRAGAVVVDVGTHRVSVDDGAGGTKARTVGDVRFEEAAEVAGFITPVPGGVGPVTVAMLLGNCVEAAEKAR